MELKDHEPLLVEGIMNQQFYSLSYTELFSATSFTGEAQTIGAALAPKTAMNVMKGEVARVYQLVKNGIHPLCCTVPRKTYREFHTDLFPDTVGNEPGLSAQEWFKGSNNMVTPPTKVYGRFLDKKKLFLATKIQS